MFFTEIISWEDCKFHCRIVPPNHWQLTQPQYTELPNTNRVYGDFLRTQKEKLCTSRIRFMHSPPSMHRFLAARHLQHLERLAVRREVYRHRRHF